MATEDTEGAGVGTVKKSGGTLLIRLKEEDRQLFERASKADGFTHVSEWVRHMLRKAAKRALASETRGKVTGSDEPAPQ
jgi:uncharacterized protein (DUF1778 family)